MKKIILGLGLVVVLCVPAFAGDLDVGLRAGFYCPYGAANPSLMYGLEAKYDVMPQLWVRGIAETTTYLSGAQQVTYTPISVDILYVPLMWPLRPYAGVGLNYNGTSVGGTTTYATGGQAEVGVDVDLGLLQAAFEYRYMVSNLNNLGGGTSVYDGYISGKVYHSLRF